MVKVSVKHICAPNCTLFPPSSGSWKWPCGLSRRRVWRERAEPERSGTEEQELGKPSYPMSVRYTKKMWSLQWEFYRECRISVFVQRPKKWERSWRWKEKGSKRVGAEESSVGRSRAWRKELRAPGGPLATQKGNCWFVKIAPPGEQIECWCRTRLLWSWAADPPVFFFKKKIYFY